MGSKSVVLIADDEKNTREGLRAALETRYDILLAEDGRSAVEKAKNELVDIALIDLKMPDMDGITVMQRIKGISPDTLVIILTAYGTIETAVEAMKKGAYDFVTKPVNLDELDILIDRALENRKIERENIQLKETLYEKYGFENIIGNTPQMKKIFGTIRQVAPTRATVLITGESGTGKELIARAIHFNSPRKDKPFVDVHCASLAESLLESELFGHEKGAFTGAIQSKPGRFELADGGTLFLDEVSEMNLSIQVKLLRVLETKVFQRVGGTKSISVDVRVVVATNADLEERIKEGKFREDLYYRLNVVSIKLPPLRERKEDIPLLVNAFINQFNKEHGKNITSITPEAMDKLMGYRWPGNVRELKNLIESIVILSKKDYIDVEDLPVHIREGIVPSYVVQDTVNVKDVEKTLIQEALRKTGNNKTKAAQELGISRRTLHRKIREYGL